MLFFTTTMKAQQQLNNYVKEGLISNLGVKQLNADYSKALWTLKEVKRMYGPNLDAVASYTHTFREGIAIPAVDSTNALSVGLHKMLEQSNSGLIKDGKIYFPLPQQYMAGVQLTQTIYSAELHYNRDMKEAGTQQAKARLEDFKISLEADIRSAYFQYLEAYYVKIATAEGMDIAVKNLHSVENQISAQKATKEALYKSRANVSLVATK